MILVALRFDDPSAISDHALEQGIISVLEKNGANATFAVIPMEDGQSVRPDVMSHLIKANTIGTIEIAQHGLTHARNNNDKNHPSEFNNADASVQALWIREGKEILERVFTGPIRGFVPPFNTCDQGTADGLELLGFNYLSAGWEHHLPKIEKLAILPRTCAAHELDAAVYEAQRYHGGDRIIVAVMHHYDFSEHGSGNSHLNLATFDELLGRLKAQTNVRLLTLDTLAAQYTATTWLAAVKRRRFVRQFHWRLQPLLPRLCLTTTSLLSSLHFSYIFHRNN